MHNSSHPDYWPLSLLLYFTHPSPDYSGKKSGCTLRDPFLIKINYSISKAYPYKCCLPHGQSGPVGNLATWVFLNEIVLHCGSYIFYRRMETKGWHYVVSLKLFGLIPFCMLVCTWKKRCPKEPNWKPPVALRQYVGNCFWKKCSFSEKKGINISCFLLKN